MATSMQRSRISSLLARVKSKHSFQQYLQSSAVQTEKNNDEEDVAVEYPPIKPKYPPGNWGSMDTKMAWNLHKEEEKVKSMSTIQERFNYFATKDSIYGSKVWKYNPVQSNLGMSDYQQDKTKTVVFDGVPKIVKDIDVDVEGEYKQIKDIFIDKILEEYDRMDNKKCPVGIGGFDEKEYKTTKLIKSLVIELVIALSQKFEHSLYTQIDPDVEISAYWERYGVRAFKPYFHSKKGDPWRILSTKYLQNYSKYQSSVQLSCQLRSSFPLPEFLPRDDVKCTSEPYPECRFWPNHMGTTSRWMKPHWDPGYQSYDPCQYVYLSFISRLNRQIEYLGRQFKPEVVDELIKYYGMNTAFISAVAQAHNQGFNTLSELTYPFTTQTILTDGRLYSIYSYQLNTLHLWKDDDANPLRNICFIQDKLPLYDTIENGELKGFNDETLKAILKCFLLKPVDPGCDLRPTLPPESPDKTVSDGHVPKPVEQVITEHTEKYDET